MGFFVKYGLNVMLNLTNWWKWSSCLWWYFWTPMLAWPNPIKSFLIELGAHQRVNLHCPRCWNRLGVCTSDLFTASLESLDIWDKLLICKFYLDILEFSSVGLPNAWLHSRTSSCRPWSNCLPRRCRRQLRQRQLRRHFRKNVPLPVSCSCTCSLPR